MTDVLLFHHALGLTDGVRAFADELRRAGHAVTTPDLFDGMTFDSLDAGVVHAEQIGFEVIADRGAACADVLPERLAVVGFSLGVLPAQKLAQTRNGVVAAVLCHSAIPLSVFGDGWPDGVDLQLHFSEEDPWAADDLDAAGELVAASGGELFRYPGSGHLVADPSTGDYEPEAAAQILSRTLALLDRVG